MLKDIATDRRSEKRAHVISLTTSEGRKIDPVLAQDAAPKLTSSDLLFIVSVLTATSDKKQRAFLRESGF